MTATQIISAVRSTTRILHPSAVDAKTIAAWADLEARALEPNVYLSPYFVLPAAKYLDPSAPLCVVLIERQQGAAQTLIGAGVFIKRRGSRHLPLPHLEAYRSPHSFSSGLLIDRDHAEAAIDGFLDYFGAARYGRHGVVFSDCYADGALSRLRAQGAARHLKWFEFDSAERAILIPAEAGQSYLERALGSRRKDIERRKRLLEKQGQVAWRVCDGSAGNFEPSIARFLELEHMGWKGQEGTSLLACAGHAQFFREMTTGLLLQRRAFFTELMLDGEVISSTSNLVSGSAGFAFKIGWNPAYAKMAPGLLNELQLIKQAPELCAGLDYIDSGAAAGSYLEKLWPARHSFVYGALTTTRIAQLALTAADYFRHHKQKLRA